jgi:hypothetical protein
MRPPPLPVGAELALARQRPAAFRRQFGVNPKEFQLAARR